MENEVVLGPCAAWHGEESEKSAVSLQVFEGLSQGEVTR
jgi:hypothetical protein